MKHKLSLVLVTMMVILGLFISCNNNISEEPTAMVNFSNTSNGSRSLGTSYELPQADKLYWKYTATKASGLSTGAVSNAWVIDENTKGLNNNVGPFSMGTWTFTLSGYSKDRAGVLSKVYEGSISVVINTTDTQQINVPVNYVGTVGKGNVTISSVYLKNRNEAVLEAKTLIVTIDSLTDNNFTKVIKDLVASGESKFNCDAFELPHGVYSFKFTFKDEAEVVNAEVTKNILVLAGRTTIISGNVAEDTASATFIVEFRDNDYYQIGNYYYVFANTEEAYNSALVAAAKNTSENVYIILSNDITLSNGTVIKAATTRDINMNATNIAIDLNGHNLSLSSESTSESLLTVDASNKKVLLLDSTSEGKLDAGTNKTAISVKNGTLEVNDGNISGLKAISIEQSGAVDVKGGSISATLVAIDNNGQLTVSGGVVESKEEAAIRTSSDVKIEGNASVAGRTAVLATANVTVEVKDSASIKATDGDLKAVEASNGVTVITKNNESETTHTGNIETSLFAGGYGTETSPYLIKSVEQLLIPGEKQDNTLYYKLLDNIELQRNDYNKYYIWTDIDFDLNGFTLTLNGQTIVGGPKPNNSEEYPVTFSVKNGNVVSKTNLAPHCAGIELYNQATFNATKVTYTSDVTGVFAVNNNNGITINSTDCTLNASGYYGIGTNASTPEPSQGVIFNLKNTNINVDRDDDDCTGILFNVRGHVNIENSTITAGRQAVILRGGKGHIITNSNLVVNGKRDDYSDDHTEDGNWQSGNATALAGLVIGNRNSSAYNYPTSVTLNDVKITLPEGKKHYAVYTYQYSNDDSRKVSVTGSLSSDSANKVNADMNGATYSVTGSVFHVNDEKGLQESLNRGSEIVLDKDFSVTKTIYATKDASLNLNGKTITCKNDIWNEKSGDWSIISVRNKAKLTINGDGKIEAKKDDAYALDVYDGGNLIINGGEFIGNVHCVYVYEGSLLINGGAFSIDQTSDLNEGTTPYGYMINLLDSNRKNGTATAVISGGRFINFDPSNCAAEGPTTNFVNSGYKVTSVKEDNNTIYSVVLN